MKIDITLIRHCVATGQYRITGHASVEAAKDGISPADIRYTIFHGKIIEEYTKREQRAQSDSQTYLIYAILPGKVPVHVVVDVQIDPFVVVVTAYVPDRQRWLASQRRKRDKRKR